MDVQAIREALAARLATIPSVRTFAFPPDLMSPTTGSPAIYVTNGEPYVDYHQAFAGGLAFVNLTISAHVPNVDPKSAWAAVDALISSGTGVARSLVDTLMGTDRTLGGVCSDLVVDSVTVSSQSDNNVRWLVADFAVRILVGRT